MDVRQFIFFDVADSILFTRTDAESATWEVSELSLSCLFPYVPEKLIRSGMRIAFEDDDGVLQPFEVRKVRNYPQDEYQEITCEHIVISELTDVHTGEQELTGVTASSALSTILLAQPSGQDGLIGAKRWTVGNVTASGTSSGDIGMGSVWQNVRTIETNWNVYILPRVTWNASGITGRYLDIVPAAGIWHGLRLSIDKNADEAGVTVDDTEVKTALFGYGGNSFTYKTSNLDKDKEKVTLVGYTWPGKPSGASINSTLGYIEDTAATAMYGRNGVPRFGFYQNGDIDDQSVLANKTWEALQTTNKPTVTVDCMVRDLYRLGYHDEKIRLHDKVLIDLLPMNDVLQLDVIQLSVDLLDPTATRPTIGAYVPNIIYIQRRTDERASGGKGGGISGRRGGETESEAEWSEFQAEFVVNNAIMSYHAVQVDHDNKVLKAAGLDIDANGVIIYATDNVNMIGSKFQATADAITQEVTDRSNADVTLQSNITQEANRITQIVTAVGDNGEVTAASIVIAINDDNTSGVTIEADHIQITGNTGILGALQVEGVIVSDDIFTSGGLSATETIYSNAVATNSITVEGDISCQDISAETIDTLGAIDCGGTLYADSTETGTLYVDGVEMDATAVKSFGTATSSGGQINIPYYTFASGSRQAGTINFNIADTAYYQSHIGINSTGSWLWDTDSEVYYRTITPNDGQDVDINLPTITATAGNFANHKSTVTVSGPGNHAITTTVVDATNEYTDGITEGESHFSPAGRVYLRNTSPHYFKSTTIYEATGDIYLKLHPATEVPTGSWYSAQSGSSGATLHLYTRRQITVYLSDSSGTAYYTSNGYSDNYYTYTG